MTISYEIVYKAKNVMFLKEQGSAPKAQGMVYGLN